jgi:hypothetical protein
MSDLLETVLEAHGGLPRWTQLETVSARLIQGGALWGLKGQEGVLDEVFVTASLHEERVSHRPFGAPDRRSAFTPGRVAIETGDGTVVEALEQPRTSFAVHSFETPWTTLQLAYFAGYAMTTTSISWAAPAPPTTSPTTRRGLASWSPPSTGSFRKGQTAKRSASRSSSPSM